MLLKAGDGIGEKHRAEPADHDIKVLRRETVDLRVRLFEPHIAQSLRMGENLGLRDHPCRNVDAHCAPGRCTTRRPTRRLSGSAPDVEDAVTATDIAGQAQNLVVQSQLGVVVHGVRHARPPSRSRRLRLRKKSAS
jgi:hypothetical protein